MGEDYDNKYDKVAHKLCLYHQWAVVLHLFCAVGVIAFATSQGTFSSAIPWFIGIAWYVDCGERSTDPRSYFGDLFEQPIHKAQRVCNASSVVDANSILLPELGLVEAFGVYANPILTFVALVTCWFHLRAWANLAQERFTIRIPEKEGKPYYVDLATRWIVVPLYFLDCAIWLIFYFVLCVIKSGSWIMGKVLIITDNCLKLTWRVQTFFTVLLNCMCCFCNIQLKVPDFQEKPVPKWQDFETGYCPWSPWCKKNKDENEEISIPGALVRIQACSTLRWIEYSVTASTMMIIILAFTGFPTLQLWFLAIAINCITMWIGYDISNRGFERIKSEQLQTTYNFDLNDSSNGAAEQSELVKKPGIDSTDQDATLFTLAVVIQSIIWFPLAIFNIAGVVQAIKTSIEEGNGGMFYGVIFFFVNFATFATFPAIFGSQWIWVKSMDSSSTSQVNAEVKYVVASFVAKFLWQLFFFVTVHQWLTMS